MDAPIYVTRPTMPPLEEFTASLEKIWSSRLLTNGGTFHQSLEAALCAHLGVKHVSLFTNATIALVTALQALEIDGEVITTPYSFAATAHSLLWNRMTPVFVDVDPQTLNLDPKKIEAAITPATKAILPVHCYGRPCDVLGIREIANRHGLKVLYDAAHAFGIRVDGSSLLNHGDLSVLSFHATKVFNTFEGGAIISHDAEMKLRIDQLKNFGFVDEVTVVAPGINGKMSEVNAAFGLLQLQYVEANRQRRLALDAHYRRRLAGIGGIRCMAESTAELDNHGYFPIFVENGQQDRDRLYRHLREHGIHARRYFYPLLSDMPMYRDFPSAHPARLPVASAAAARVLCLPMYADLEMSQVDFIVDCIARQSA